MALLLIILIPAFAGTGIVGLVDDDADLDDSLTFANILMEWAGSSTPELMAVLNLSLSFFVMFIAYLGGRSKNKWFNDRTLDSIKSEIEIISKTALIIRAVFYYRLVELFTGRTTKKLILILSPQINFI